MPLSVYSPLPPVRVFTGQALIPAPSLRHHDIHIRGPASRAGTLYLTTPPTKLPRSTSRESRIQPVVIRFHLGATRLVVIPILAFLFLGTSYVWDVQQGKDCDLSEAILNFDTPLAQILGALVTMATGCNEGNELSCAEIQFANKIKGFNAADVENLAHIWDVSVGPSLVRL